MKSLLFHLLLFVISTNLAYGQKSTIAGQVKDSLNQGIELATVILTSKKDSVMAGFSITNPQGKFKIEDIEAGEYTLSLTYLGMSDINKDLDVDQDVDLGIINMTAASSDLETVVVTASHIPIQIKKDTIQYNADAYKTRPADNVEELLKQLPGVEVDDDGTITAHGESVENVFVDGKEFFGNDPTIATKNLPALVIDNVQVYNKRSDATEFSGIDDGERQKTINLVLKEGKKAGYFGNAAAGAGTDERYESKFNVNRFTKKTQMSAIGMINNTNKQGFSYGEARDFIGGLGGMMRGGNSTNSTGVNISNGSLGNGFVKTGAGGLNYNIEPNKNIEINSSYFFNRIDNNISRELNRENLLNRDNRFTTIEVSDQLNLSNAHNINSKIELKIDSTQRIITRVALGWTNGNSSDIGISNNINQLDQILSGTDYENSAFGDKMNASINSNYMKRLSKPGRFFTTNVRLGLSNNDQESDIFSINQFLENQRMDTLNQDQILSNYENNYLVKVSLTEPLGKRRYLEFNLTRRNLNNDYRKDFFDITSDGRILNDQFSNNYLRDYTYNTVGTTLKINKESSSFTMGGNIQHSALNGSLDDNEIDIKQDYYYFLPRLFWNFDLSATRSLRLRYTTSIREPSLIQLNPIPDISNPLNFYLGNPDLNPSYNHRFNLNYNSYSQFSNIGFFSYLDLRYTKNNITNTQIVDSALRQTTMPINTDYLFSSTVYFNFNAPLKFIKQRINLSNSLNYTDRFLFINQKENKLSQVSNRVNVSLENWKKDFIDLEIGTRINFNTNAYSENTERNQNYINYQYFIDVEFDFKNDWNINSYFRNQIFSEEDFGEQISISTWRASLSKILGANKKYKVDISAFDLLNQNQNVIRTTNANYIQDERINTIGRYVLFTLTYSFSGFGQTSSRGGGRGGRGPRF